MVEADRTCPDPELLTALVDDELDHAGRDATLAHVASCAHCRPAVDDERRVRAMVRALPDTDEVPSSELLARLRAVPTHAGAVHAGAATQVGVTSLDQHRAKRAGRAPAYLGAAASVAVFMVGAFAFLGATSAPASPGGPVGGTAIVPAADRLTLEHAATNAQTNLGGPGVTTVAVNVPVSTPTVVAP